MKKMIFRVNLALVFVMLFQTLSAQGSSKKTRLIYSNDFVVSYSLYDTYLKIYIETSGFPSFNVDVNQNKIIDNKIDRAYGISDEKDTTKLCAQFLIDSLASTQCGQASGASLIKRGNEYVFSLPYIELSVKNNNAWFFSFYLWDGGHSYRYQEKELSDPFIISGNTISQITNGNVQTFLKVNIGNENWMPSNLDVSFFRNGDPIPEAKTAEEWSAAGANGKPAWCYFSNDPLNGAKYGKIYNGYALTDPRGLAPKGWHIPSYNELTQLVTYIGENPDAGTEMKNTEGWVEEGNGTNECGFAGLPGGLRYSDGAFAYAGYMGEWWCSTESLPDYSKYWSFDLEHNKTGVTINSFHDKTVGLSVRCIKD